MSKAIDEFWQEFLKAKKLPEETKYLEAFYFDLTKESANHLLELVLSGKKQATASSYLHYQGTNESLPKIGDYSIVTDFDNNPYAVIQTTNINIIPFNKLSFDTVRREGEDDCLESWQRNHIHFFTEDGKTNGYEFTEEMPVVFEDFKLIYKKERV